MPPPMQIYDGALEPVWFADREVFSVTAVAETARGKVQELPSWWVQGEISDLRVQKNLSMAYVTLKDPRNGFTVQCVMGRSRFESLGIELQDGDSVQVFARPDMYAPRGAFQLRLQTIEHTGRGALMEKLEALREQLAGEGLFDPDRKRPLPRLPRRVGLITGKGAAAEGDFIRNIMARYPPAKLVVIHSLVQGPRAAPMIVGALRTMQRLEDVDVIVLARGGGAFEDFLAFSDETVLRTIAACPVPVVSAIGHDKDQPLSDLVADHRAATPTAAARDVVPDYEELAGGLDRHHASLRRRLATRLSAVADRQRSLRARLTAHSPERFLEERGQYLDDLEGRATRIISTRLATLHDHTERLQGQLSRRAARLIDARRSAVDACRQRLIALSPMQVLERGYAIVRDRSAGTIVRSVMDRTSGDELELVLADGILDTTITGVNPGER